MTGANSLLANKINGLGHQAGEVAGDSENPQTRLRGGGIVEAKCAFADAGNGVAFHLERTFFRQHPGVSGKIFVARRAQLGVVQQPETPQLACLLWCINSTSTRPMV
jgi:hypothetical protein